MNNQEDKIRNMIESEFTHYVKSELYTQLDNHRKMNNSTSLFKDENAETAIDQYYYDGQSHIVEEHHMNQIMINVYSYKIEKCDGKQFHQARVSKADHA